MEFMILPGGGWKRGGDILYIDDADDRGVQQYFDADFAALGIADKVDRYDVLDPSALVGNGPGSRVTNVMEQLAGCYRKIIWSSGSLSNGLIGDGSRWNSGTGPDKSNDFGVLLEFIDQSRSDRGRSRSRRIGPRSLLL